MNIPLILSASLALGLGFAAHASEPPRSQVASGALPTASEIAEDDGWIADRQCLRQTGSRISVSESRRLAREARRGAAVQPQASDSNCALAPGRAYSREDLLRTGAMDVGEALRRLDPSVR